jgi:hypothetical protein
MPGIKPGMTEGVRGHDGGEVGHHIRNVMAGFVPAIHVLLVEMP